MNPLIRRLERLEQMAGGQDSLSVIFVGFIDAKDGRPVDNVGRLIGYESRDGTQFRIMRKPGESDDELQARAEATVGGDAILFELRAFP
jgi:hypothetical protein